MNALSSVLGAEKTGGSGHRFDWASIPDRKSRAAFSYLILAGGLTPDNVASGIREVQPFAVDVSSGIESSPGIKDAEKMRQFVNAVSAA